MHTIVIRDAEAPYFTSAKWVFPAIALLLSAFSSVSCSTRSPYDGVSGAAVHNSATPNLHTQTVQPGDTIEVYVIEDESLNGRYEIREGGNIILPKVGKIPVAGKTSSEIEVILKKVLETNQLRTATVMVERPATPHVASSQVKTVFVSGNVGAPGRRAVPYLGDLRPTVYQAIVDAGGFSRFADDSHVLVTRQVGDGKTVRLKVNAERVRDGAIPDVPLEDGDMIFVPEKAFGW